MKKKISVNLQKILCIAAFMAMLVSPAWAALTIKVNQDLIKINYDYNGSTVSVGGISDPGMDLIIKISSEAGNQSLRRKDKVAGFLWMNVDTLHFQNIPDVYFLRSTRKVQDILTDQQRKEHSLGYNALEENARLSSEKGVEQVHRWFSEFFKYKESNNLYSFSTGGIDVNNGDYNTVFQWPFQAAPGKYIVTVYSAKDGKVIEKAESEVVVEQAGIIKMLSNMAQNNGSMYGIIAIVIALAAGFGVGMIFGKSGGAH